MQLHQAQDALSQPWMLASTNPHKAEELQALVARLGVKVAPAPHALDVVEDAPNFLGNATLKAQAYAKSFNSWALADDSGLMVNALNGQPGVFSARYAPSDPERIARLLHELGAAPNRQARFVCALVLCQPNGEVVVAQEGICTGRITHAPRGSHGFGYDPIFEVESGRTFAELSADEKLEVGHRGQAGRALAARLLAVS